MAPSIPKENPMFLLDLSPSDLQEHLNASNFSMQVEDLHALYQTLDTKKDLIVDYKQKRVILRNLIERNKSDAKMSVLLDLSSSNFQKRLNASDFSMQVEDLDVLYQELTILERLARNNIKVFEKNADKSVQDQEKITIERNLMINAGEKLKILCEKELSILADLSPRNFLKHLSVREYSIKVEDLEALYNALTKQEKLERQNLDFFERKQDKTPEGREEKAFEKDLVRESVSKLNILSDFINKKKSQKKVTEESLLHINSLIQSLKKRYQENKDSVELEKFINSDKSDINYLLRQPESYLLEIEHELEHLLSNVDILLIDIKKQQPHSNKELFADVLQRAICVSNEYLAALNPYHYRYHSLEPSGRFVQYIQYAFCPIQYGYKTLELCSICPKDSEVNVQNTPYLYVRHNNVGMQQIYCAFKSKEGTVERFEIKSEELHDESHIIWLALQHKVLTWKQEQKIFRAIETLKGDRYQLSIPERLAVLEKIEAPAEAGVPVPINDAILKKKFDDAKKLMPKTQRIMDKVKDDPRFSKILENKEWNDQEKLQKIFEQEKKKKEAEVSGFLWSSVKKIYVDMSRFIKNILRTIQGDDLVPTKEEVQEKNWEAAQIMYQELKVSLEQELLLPEKDYSLTHLDKHARRDYESLFHEKPEFIDKKRSSNSDDNPGGVALKNTR